MLHVTQVRAVGHGIAGTAMARVVFSFKFTVLRANCNLSIVGVEA